MCGVCVWICMFVWVNVNIKHFFLIQAWLKLWLWSLWQTLSFLHDFYKVDTWQMLIQTDVSFDPSQVTLYMFLGTSTSFVCGWNFNQYNLCMQLMLLKIFECTLLFSLIFFVFKCWCKLEKKSQKKKKYSFTSS